MLTASQIARGFNREEVIGGEGVSDSWLKLADADLFATLGASTEDMKHGILRLHFPKLRRAGGTSSLTIMLRYYGDYAFIRECTQEEVDHYTKWLKEHQAQQAKEGWKRRDGDQWKRRDGGQQ